MADTRKRYVPHYARCIQVHVLEWVWGEGRDAGGDGGEGGKCRVLGRRGMMRAPHACSAAPPPLPPTDGPLIHCSSLTPQSQGVWVTGILNLKPAVSIPHVAAKV